MNRISAPFARMLLVLLLIYGAASLVHFIHNAEFLADYPGLPDSWTRAGVYGAWLGMTAIGVIGWALITVRREVAGLLLIIVYAACGLDSLGHYVVAPISAHTIAMNVTILLEVTAAGLVMLAAGRLLTRRILLKKA